MALRKRVAPIVAPVLAAAPHHAIGLVLVADGKTTLLGRGHRSGSDPRPPDARTTFEIGSVAKVLAGVILADAERRGEVRLDAPARTYLPKDIPLPPDRGRPITLRDLASHMSGLPYMPKNFIPLDPVTHKTRYGLHHLRTFLRAYSLRRTTGERYHYSNLGTALLAIALPARTGMPWPVLLKRRLLGPLGMQHTTYVDRDDPSARKNSLAGHDDNGRPCPGGSIPRPSGPAAPYAPTSRTWAG